MAKKLVRVNRSAREDIVGKSYAVDLSVSPPKFEAIAPDPENPGEFLLTPVAELDGSTVTVNGNDLTARQGKFYAMATIYAELPE